MFLITKYLTMQMPPVQGTIDQSGFFVYTACDTDYFNDFGKTLIRSVQGRCGIHVHLYNPTTDQITYCESQPGVSVTYEHVPFELFARAAKVWEVEPTDPQQIQQRKQTLTAMGKGRDTSIQQRMQRTYYACARFIRLQQLTSAGANLLAIDSDAVVRSPIPTLSNAHDFYIHHITGKRARFLAGGIYLTGSAAGQKFLSEYAAVLQAPIHQDYLYWGIDQDVLNDIVPRYNFGNLPMPYIDWEMRPDSYIWTAKGQRKELEIFINEQQKYSA